MSVPDREADEHGVGIGEMPSFYVLFPSSYVVDSSL
jgi:hypothetical protein